MVLLTVLLIGIHSICGNYISLSKLSQPIDNNNGILKQSFRLIIPFNDIMCFGSFKEYPKALFNDLELYINLIKIQLL